jgi:hypothetical protein
MAEDEALAGECSAFAAVLRKLLERTGSAPIPYPEDPSPEALAAHRDAEHASFMAEMKERKLAYESLLGDANDLLDRLDAVGCAYDPMLRSRFHYKLDMSPQAEGEILIGLSADEFDRIALHLRDN